MIINEGDLDAYELKTQELYQMLKFSIFSEQEILKKIHHIELFVSFKKLKDFVQPLKSEKILKIAKELQPLYEALWDIKSEKEVQKKYHQLSFKTKQIYPEFEVNDDWKCRQYAKQKYESMISSLENQRFWLDDLKEQFKLYQEQQIVFPDRQEYLLNWDQILNQYKDQLLSIGEIDLHQVPSHPSNNQVAFVDFHMIACPKGSFWMHRIDDDLKPHQSQNQHKVNLSRGAWIGETPVTQALWQAVMKWNPSIHQGDLLPVVNVTWYDCLAFCNQLSKLEQLQPCFKFPKFEKKRQSYHQSYC
jgi:hypothetical protein